MGRLIRGESQRQYKSDSEADYALMKDLARLTDSNEACRSAFRMSARGKRGGKVTDDTRYLNLTLKNARAELAGDAAQADAGRRLFEGMFRPPPNPRHFRLLTDSDLEQLPPPRWLVKGIIPERGVGSIYGSSGTYKSFLALDLLAHISHGWHWFNHRTKAAPAVYVPFEGKGGIPYRVKAWRIAHGRQQPEAVSSRIAYITEPMNLRVQSDRDKLVTTLQEAGWAGGVLCIDTLAHASQGLDENSSQMGEMITIFGELQDRLDCVVLIVHHTGKDSSAGMRGWSGIYAAMDFAIECTRGEAKLTGTFSPVKVKDGEAGMKLHFSMLDIPLGEDADGEAYGSLTVTPRIELDRLVPATIDAEQDAQDDRFIWGWVKREVENGRYPSANSLQGQLGEMKDKRVMTQKRVRDAIHRLKASSLLVTDEERPPSGNPWIRTSDLIPPWAEPGSL